jgi:hypothetical protein
MLAKFLTAKVATIALTAAVAVGGVAAAATVAQSDRAVGKAVAEVDKPEAASHAKNPSRPDAGRPDAGGPDASGAARKGLCTAWAAGEGAEHGAKEDAAAFQALVEAAGGADNIASFCAEATTTSKGEAAADVELADAAKRGLCRAWAAGQAGEHGGRESVAAFEMLAKAAGGAETIATFCAGTATTPTTPTRPTPSTRAGEDRPAPPAGGAPRGSAPDDPGKDA